MFHRALLPLLGIQQYTIRCGFRAVAAGIRRRHLAIDGPSARIADRDTIVERYKEGVGIPVERQTRSAMCVTYLMRRRSTDGLTPSRVCKFCRAGDL